jgi:hypothetical protein
VVPDLSKERRAFIWKGQEVPEQLIAEDERTPFFSKRRELLCDKQRPIQEDTILEFIIVWERSRPIQSTVHSPPAEKRCQSSSIVGGVCAQPFRKQVITCEHTYYLLLIVSRLWQKIFSAVPRRCLTGTEVAFHALMKSTKMDLEEVGWGGQGLD